MKVDIEADNNELETQCEKVDVKVEKVNRKSRHFALAILLFIVSFPFIGITHSLILYKLSLKSE